MAWCLPKFLSSVFLDSLRSGEITPERLRAMTSVERHKYFSEIFGEEHAANVNAQLESKLLLKDWKRGLVTWAKEMAGLKPEAQRDIISRVNRMEKILNPEEESQFLQDLANQKLGMHVPLEAAQKLTDLAADAQAMKDKADKDGVFPTNEDRMAYGYAVEDFRTYYNGLINAAEKMTLKEYAQHPLHTLDIGIHKTLGITKSLLSTLDDSVIGRQGMQTALNDVANAALLKPTHQWWDNAIKTFSIMYKTWSGKDMEREVNAEVISRPNSLNGLYAKHRVALNIMEENFPEHFDKIPVVGRTLKGFENAFSGFQKLNRADTFDGLVNMAKAAGKDPFSDDISGFGKLANTLTARGQLEVGRYNLEPIGDFINLLAFAGRFFKSNLDFLTFNQLHTNMSPYARKVAAIQSVKAIAVIGGFLTLAEALNPGSVEWDDTKTTFGGITIGGVTYEPFKRWTPFVVLAARLLKREYTTKSGETYEINTDEYGGKTGKDLVVDFLSGKESPLLRIFDDVVLRGETFSGEEPTFINELKGQAPIPIQQTAKNINNPSLSDADKIGAWLAETIGVTATPIDSGK